MKIHGTWNWFIRWAASRTVLVAQSQMRQKFVKVCVCVFAMGNVFFWFPCNSVPCSPQHFVCFNHVPTRDSTSTVLLHLPSWERSHIPSKFTFESMIFLFPRVGYVIVPCKVYNLCIVECLHKTFARSVDLTCIGAILFLGARWDGWWRIGWKWSFAV